MNRHEDDYTAEAAALGDGHAENYQDDHASQYHAGFGTYAG